MCIAWARERRAFLSSIGAGKRQNSPQVVTPRTAQQAAPAWALGGSLPLHRLVEILGSRGAASLPANWQIHFFHLPSLGLPIGNKQGDHIHVILWEDLDEHCCLNALHRVFCSSLCPRERERER